jgi:hypothetical protein
MSRHFKPRKNKRRKHFAAPVVPKQLVSTQKYGVITQYLGGHTKRMNVTTCDAVGVLLPIVCSLKGSLRPSKCKQNAQKGSYCIVDDIGQTTGVVVLIMAINDCYTIPTETYDKLQRVTADSLEEDDVEFEAQEDPFATWSSDEESDGDVVFSDGHADPIDSDNQDIDLI